MAYWLQRYIDLKANFLNEFTSSGCFRRLTSPDAATGEVPSAPIRRAK
jgi:hypothetical protein